jgi:molybdenum cofactor cytidylyltransferase
VTTATLVLAAGGGSRFAGPTHKLLAPVDGTPVVVRAVEAAVGSGLPVVVVQGAVDLAGALAHLDVELVRHEGWAEGQASSLRAGIDAVAAAGHDAVVVGLGDQPGIPASAWGAVAAAASAPIAVATYGGRRRNPVRLAAEVWPLLPTTGDEGARSLIRSRPELVVEVACDGDPVDVDTQEDLGRWN